MSSRWLKKYTRDGSPLRFIAKMFRARVAPNATALDMPESSDLLVTISDGAVRIENTAGVLVLPTTAALWFARALLRAVLAADVEHIVERGRVTVAANCWTLANGKRAVLVNGSDALFILSEAGACSLALAVLDVAPELVEPPRSTPVVLVLSDLSQQAAHPA